MAFECSTERPWGIHPEVRNDEPCRRCGWVAPGPIGDAIADRIAAGAETNMVAAQVGWTVHSGGDGAEALAA
jgi:hypothetical protein